MKFIPYVSREMMVDLVDIISSKIQSKKYNQDIDFVVNQSLRVWSHQWKKYKIGKQLSRTDILTYIHAYDISLPDLNLVNILKKRSIRSTSGVNVITVFTSPYPEWIDAETGKHKKQRFSCAYNCAYCPAEPGQPRSYIKDAPSTRRANQNDFDPVRQFLSRASTLYYNGHDVDKIEIIVLGGTWTSYPMAYREWFIRQIFYSANIFEQYITQMNDKKKQHINMVLQHQTNENTLVEQGILSEIFSIGRGLSEEELIEFGIRGPLDLAQEKINNRTAWSKIIGLTIETRPDQICEDE